MQETFARYGSPKIVRSDNGRQFDSFEFRQFAKDYNFKWKSSSPRYPQSNGQAESAVKLIKRIYKKSDDPYLGLLAYRNTKLECGASPAQLLMGRNLRENLPILESKLIPKLPNHKEVRKNMMKQKDTQKKNYDRRYRTRDLEELDNGTRVFITTENKEGQIINQAKEPRSYIIETDDKEQLRRNRRHLQKLPTPVELNIPKNTPKTVTSPNQSCDEMKEKTEIRRGIRDRKIPKKFKDYILK